MRHTNVGDIVKKISIWTDGIKDQKLPSLNEDTYCDVLIIGGGIAGLSAAYELKDSNKKIVLIDKEKCGLGATSNNTGKLTFMQDLIYHKIAKNYSNKEALLYMESQKEAINRVKDIIKSNNIDCDLVKTKAYIFTNNEKKYSSFDKEIKFYQDNNIKYKVKEELPVLYPSKCALETDDSYVLNPYKYLIGLKNILKDKITIYEGTRIVNLEKKDDYYICKTDKYYQIKSPVVVVATHYPFFIVPYFTPFKTRVDKFSIAASLSDDYKNIQIISNDNPSISIRYYNKNKQNYLLYGRNSHSTITKLNMEEDYNETSLEYKKYFNRDIDYFWHSHDLMTYDNMPFIGKIDNNLYVMTGFNKWGNTNGVIGGKVISDLILNKENKYVNIFNPKRSISLDKLKNVSTFNITVISRYVLNKINPHMKYYQDDVKIKFINGKRCGIYKDNNGIEHIVSNICPHMKCNLIFNYLDKTWDCPCHASRFDIDGNVINGPSTYDIKLK